MEDKSPKRGRKLSKWIFIGNPSSRMEDKSPKRGRKLVLTILKMKVTYGMEDKSPKRGRKHLKSETIVATIDEWKISPRRGDGNFSS